METMERPWEQAAADFPVGWDKCETCPPERTTWMPPGYDRTAAICGKCQRSTQESGITAA